VNSLIAWAGGKYRLRSLIIKRIPNDHVCYAEPCCGAASVFFGKTPSRLEVLNDVDDELVNLFSVVKLDPEAFAKGVEWMFSSRRIYTTLKAGDPRRLCPATRAVRFYYLIMLGFGCKRSEMCFGVTPSGGARRFCASNVIERVREIHKRLERAVIECLPATEMIKRYDRPATFFFVDPPYHGVSQPYAGKMDADDQEELRDVLADCKGRWLMTNSDHPFIRKLYRGFALDVLPTRYSLMTDAKARARRLGTLLVGNYDHKALAKEGSKCGSQSATRSRA
jgi:DNA adenine methylase